jgi:hypothetical protein
MEALAEEGKKAHEPLRLTGVYATSGRTQRLVLIRKFFMLYWRNPNYSERLFFLSFIKQIGGRVGWGTLPAIQGTVPAQRSAARLQCPKVGRPYQPTMAYKQSPPPPAAADVVRFFMTACIGIVLGLVFLNEVGGPAGRGGFVLVGVRQAGGQAGWATTPRGAMATCALHCLQHAAPFPAAPCGPSLSLLAGVAACCRAT